MEFKVVSAPELYLYMYNNCNDICGRAGYAGLTRVNFDGEQIVIHDFPSYFVKRDDIELNQYMKWLIKALSSDEDCGKMLSSPKAMKAYCEKHPEAEINEHAIIDYLQREHCGKALAVKATELQRRFGVTPRQLRTIVSSARCEIIPICSDGSGYYYPESAEEIARTRAMIRAQAMSMLNAARGLDKAFEAFGKSYIVS